MEQTESRRLRLEELDICRAIAALSVLLIHITAVPVGVMDKTSLLFRLFFAVNRGLQYSVPLFLVMSALLEAYALKGKEAFDFKGFYQKKSKRVLLPYLAWSVIYMGFNLLLTKFGYFQAMNEARELIDIFVWGKAYYHLYFLVILMQFYLLLPLLFYSQKSGSLRWFSGLLLSYLLQIAFYYGIGKQIYPYFPNIIMTFPWYFFVLNGGFLLGLFYREKEKWQRCRPWFGLITLLSLLYYLWKCFRLEYVPQEPIALYMPAWYLYTFGISFLWLDISAVIARRGGKWVNGLKTIGKYSYGIYLIHPLVLTLHLKVLDRLPVPGSFLYALMILALTVSVLLISLGAARLLSAGRWAKYTAWLIGGK